MVLGMLHMCGKSCPCEFFSLRVANQALQSCDQPFENPAFFQRDGKPFCEHCFSVMIRNEI